MDSNLTNIDMQFHMNIEKSLTNICKFSSLFYVFYLKKLVRMVVGGLVN